MNKQELADKVNELQSKLDLQDKMFNDLSTEYKAVKEQNQILSNEKELEAAQAKQILKKVENERNNLQVKEMALKDVKKDLEEYKSLCNELKAENMKLEKAIIKLSTIL